MPKPPYDKRITEHKRKQENNDVVVDNEKRIYEPNELIGPRLIKKLTLQDRRIVPWLEYRDTDSEYEGSEIAELGRSLSKYLKQVGFQVGSQYAETEIDEDNILYVQITTTHEYKSQSYTITFDFTYYYKRVRLGLDPIVTYDDVIEYLYKKVMDQPHYSRCTEARMGFYYDLVSLRVFINELYLEM